MDIANNRGFTLTELMVVIAVILILGAVSVPNIVASIPSYNLRKSARDLCSDMRRARSIAVKQNRNVAIVFNTAEGSYTIDGGDPISIEESYNISFGSAGATQSATEPPGTLPTDGISFLGNIVTFNYQGLSNAGYVYLQNVKGEAFAVGALTSGRITLKQWYGTVWK